MSRNVLFTSAVVALTGSLALFADPKIKPDPVGPPQLVQQDAPNVAIQAGRRGKVAVQVGTPHGQWSWKNPDQALASCVAIGNHEEVALGQLGSEKAQNEDVKKFAQMLVTDHQEFLEKLKPFAPEASAMGFLKTESREARAKSPAVRTDVKQADADTNEPAKIEVTAGTKPADGAHQGFRHLQIEREVAQQCLALATEKLNSETGAKFDKCFIGQQIGMHAGMKAKLIVYQRHASSELGQVLAQGQKKTEEHLAKAEELMKSLEGNATTTSTRDASKTKATDTAKTDKEADKE